MRQLSGLPSAADAKPQAPQLIANRNERKAVRAQAALNRVAKAHQGKTPAPAVTLNHSSTRPLASGFYVNWDDSSYQSLKRHVQQLDQLVPEWLRLQSGDHPVMAEIDQRALDLVHSQRPELPIIPMIHNSKDGTWESQTLVKQIGDEASRTRLVNDLARLVEDSSFQGVCIDFEEVPELELTATQRLIESLTGRSTRLFRAPYFGDAEPQTADEVEPAAIANRLGYIIAGLRVDPDDWALPGADAIVQRTLAGIENPNLDERGQVVLLHDGGGDRAQTVAALPRLIHDLRAKGYRFTTISQLAGMTARPTARAMWYANSSAPNRACDCSPKPTGAKLKR